MLTSAAPGTIDNMHRSVFQFSCRLMFDLFMENG